MKIHFDTDEFDKLVPANEILYYRNKNAYWTYAILVPITTKGKANEYVFLKYRKIEDIKFDISFIPISQPTDEIQEMLDNKSNTWIKIEEQQISESDCYEIKRILYNNINRR